MSWVSMQDHSQRALPTQQEGVRSAEPEPPRSQPFCGQLGEDGLQFLGEGAQKDHVAGGTVHVQHAAAAAFPDIHDFAQTLGLVELGSGLVYAQGVEVLHAGEQVGNV
jgi:hypothetical protein